MKKKNKSRRRKEEMTALFRVFARARSRCCARIESAQNDKELSERLAYRDRLDAFAASELAATSRRRAMTRNGRTCII